MTEATKSKEKKIKQYETICLTKVDMPEDKFNALIDKAKKAITEEGKGEWLYNDDWGKAKISYPIGKEPRAQWTYFRFRSESSGVDEMIRGLGINEFVLRQMTTVADESGADYASLRPTFAKDLSERDKPREWKDPRRSRGPRGEGRDRDRDFRGGEGRYESRNFDGPPSSSAPAEDQSPGAKSPVEGEE